MNCYTHANNIIVPQQLQTPSFLAVPIPAPSHPQFNLDLETLKRLFKTAQISNSKSQIGGKSSDRSLRSARQPVSTKEESMMVQERPTQLSAGLQNVLGSNMAQNTGFNASSSGFQPRSSNRLRKGFNTFARTTQAQPINYDTIKSVQELKATFGIGAFSTTKSSSGRKPTNLRKSIKKAKKSRGAKSNKQTKARKATKKSKSGILKKRKVLRDLPSLTATKSKISKSKKRTICFLTDSEQDEINSTSQIKCFRPKNINESGKSKLLRLIRRKSERNLEKITQLKSTAKKSLQWQMESVFKFRSQLREQRKDELRGLYQFENALDDIEMQILFVPTK